MVTPKAFRKVFRRFHHLIHEYGVLESDKKKFIFVYKPTIHHMNKMYYNMFQQFKYFEDACMKYIENETGSAEGYIRIDTNRHSMPYIWIYNIFHKSKIIVIEEYEYLDGISPMFNFSTGAREVDRLGYIDRYPYKYNDQLFYCRETRSYYKYISSAEVAIKQDIKQFKDYPYLY